MEELTENQKQEILLEIKILLDKGRKNIEINKNNGLWIIHAKA